jgi:hypothetical protein
MGRYHGGYNRFLQPDPYEDSYSLADPQSFNRYAYVQNDPVNLVDPSGLDPDDPTFGLGPPPPPPGPSDPTFGLGDPPPPPGTGDGGVVRVWTWVPGWNDLPRLFDLPMAMPVMMPPDIVPVTLLDPQRPPQTQPPPEERIHCDPDVQKAIEQIFSRQQASRSGGSKGNEYGFKVDRNPNGGYTVGPIETNNAGREVTYRNVIQGVTVALIHTHPDGDIDPSRTDRGNADRYGTVSYVRTFRGGLRLYNPKNSKDPSGKNDRIIKAPKC